MNSNIKTKSLNKTILFSVLGIVSILFMGREALGWMLYEELKNEVQQMAKRHQQDFKQAREALQQQGHAMEKNFHQTVNKQAQEMQEKVDDIQNSYDQAVDEANAKHHQLVESMKNDDFGKTVIAEANKTDEQISCQMQARLHETLSDYCKQILQFQNEKNFAENKS